MQVNIPKKAKIRVVWEDSPENYTQERQKRVAKYFAEKYSNTNVQVIFKPKKIEVEGQEIEMTISDNVMDISYQRKLFKKWLEDNKVDVDWERLLNLDDKVNEKLSQKREVDYRYRNWSIKNIEWSNFLSYGDGNVLSFQELEGITVITSDPPNMGGKTVLALDLLLFLFFNTTTKGSTAIKMFNKFRDKDEVKVKGTVVIDGVDYIIERVVTRKLKRNKIDYNTRTDLSFNKVLPDGSIQNLEGEQRRETEEFIKKSIGSVDDFLLTIIADADNLEKIIHTKPTEKGRILSRFIGLEVIEDKEDIVKEMKSKWSKGLKSDQYNIVELKDTIKEMENNIIDNEEQIKNQEELLKTKINLELTQAKEKKERLLEQKVEIDTEVINLRPQDIDEQINNILKEGKEKKAKYEDAKKEFESMQEISYDETEHNSLIKEERNLLTKKSGLDSEIKRTIKLIKDLEEGEFCPTCGQALKDVDHSEEIKEKKGEVDKLKTDLTSVEGELEEISKKVSEYDEKKKMVSEYDRKSLMVDKLDLDLNRLRLELKENKDLKARYEKNLTSIEKNKELDSKVLGYSAKIEKLEQEKEENIKVRERLESEIKNLKVSIDKNKELIELIKAEEEIKIIFDVYIRMVGKNGIGKIIMGNIIPLINSELERLLIDTTDFKLLVDINDKKEVEFLIEKEEGDEKITYPITEGSGFEKTVSSLALRCVMSKVSCLPKPNIIVFDEVFGKVADENLELVGNFFNKCSEMFPNIFLITHNTMIKDWANKIITVKKVNNVSSLTIN